MAKTRTVNTRQNVYINGEQATKTIKGLYTEQRKLKNEIAQTEIGTKKYLQLTGKYKEADKKLKEHRNNMKGVQESQKGMVTQSGLFNRELALMQGAMGKVKSAGMLVVGMFKTMRGAIIATGIGALVVTIAALFTWFTKTKRGAELLNRVMAAFGATTAVLIDRVSSLGDFLIAAFKNPQKALKDLGGFLVSQIVNRFTAIIDLVKIAGASLNDLANGDFAALKDRAEEAGQAVIQLNTGLDAAQQKKIADGIKGVAAEIRNEAKAAYELEGAMQALKDTERSLRVEQAQNMAKIRELRLKGESEEQYSAEQRLQFIQEAADLETEFATRREAAAAERVRIIKEQIELGESMEEDFDKLADAEVALATTQAASLKIRTTLTAKLNTIRREGEAEANKARKAEESQLKKLNQFIDKNSEELRLKQLSDDERELNQIAAKYDKMILMAQGFEEQQRELELLKEEELRLAADLKAEEELIKHAEELIKKQQFEDELAKIGIDAESAEIAAIDAKYEALYAKADQFGIDTANLIREHEQEAHEIRENYRQLEADAQIAQQQAEEARNMARMKSASAFFGNMGTIISNFAELTGQATEEQGVLAKAAALFQIGTDTAVGISQAIADAAKIGVTPIEKAAIAAAGIAQVTTAMLQAKKVLNGSKEPKSNWSANAADRVSPVNSFAEGGNTGAGYGPADETGHRPAGLVHALEWVAPKWMRESPQHAATLEYLEFARANNIGRYAEGGVVADQNQVNVTAQSGTTTTDELLNRSIQVQEMLLKRLSQPLQAVYDDNEVLKIKERDTLLTQIEADSTL